MTKPAITIFVGLKIIPISNELETGRTHQMAHMKYIGYPCDPKYGPKNIGDKWTGITCERGFTIPEQRSTWNSGTLLKTSKLLNS